MSSSVTISAPALKLLDTVLFSVFPPLQKMTDAVMLPRGLVSHVSSPSELNIMMSLCESESLAITFVTLPSFAVIFCSRLFRKGRNSSALADRQLWRIGYRSCHPSPESVPPYPALPMSVFPASFPIIPDAALSTCFLACPPAIIAAALAAASMSVIPVFSE